MDQKEWRGRESADDDVNTDLYKVKVPDKGSWLYTLQRGMKKNLGFTLPLLHARGVFNYDVGILPYRREVNSIG